MEVGENWSLEPLDPSEELPTFRRKGSYAKSSSSRTMQVMLNSQSSFLEPVNGSVTLVSFVCTKRDFLLWKIVTCVMSARIRFVVSNLLPEKSRHYKI